MSTTPKRKAAATRGDDVEAAPAKRPRGRQCKQPAGQQPVKAVAQPVKAAEIAPLPQVKVCADPEIARLHRAVAALRPGAFQGRLPCRDTEQGEISGHLRTAVRAGGSMQVLYISGMPGTGKTASVMHAIKQLQGCKSMPALAPVFINAMRLGTPAAVFGEMYRQIPGTKPCAVHAAHGELSRLFSERKAKDPVILLVIDEIDHLITRNQAVLYKVFDWLQLSAPRLVVAAISNTMDLPERLLPRVASRFGIVRVDFAPYNRDQIVQILNERLKSQTAVEAFNPVAVKLCAARVAAGSGDIRKALQTCRRAVEIRMDASNASGPVSVSHLETAEKDLLRASPAAHAIAGLGLKARRLLAAVLLELRKQEQDVVPTQRVAYAYSKLQAAASFSKARKAAEAPSDGGLPADEVDDEVTFLLQRLDAMALLVVLEHTVGFGQSVALGAGLDAEDLTTALESTEEDEDIQQRIRESGHR